MAGIAFKDSEGNIRIADENAVVSSISLAPDERSFIREDAWRMAGDEFDEAFDCIYKGRAEWAGYYAATGWHYLRMIQHFGGLPNG